MFYVVRNCLNPESFPKSSYYHTLRFARDQALAMIQNHTAEGVHLKFTSTCIHEGDNHHEHWQSECGRYVVILETCFFED